MTRIDAYPVGAPAWVDLGVDDVASAASFYSTVLGWQFGEPTGMDDGGAWVGAMVDGDDIAGIGTRADPSAPTAWSVYLAVDDLRQRLGLVPGAGGQVIRDAADIDMQGHRLGSLAVVADPTGAVVGMWQPGEHPGIRVVDVPGAPTWFELFTRDSAAAREFYLTVFGLWSEEVADPLLGSDIMLAADGQPVAEIHRMAGERHDGIPPHWSVCFEVDEVDGALARAVSCGGVVVEGPAETDYGIVADLRDPQGAEFRVLRPGAGAAAGDLQ